MLRSGSATPDRPAAVRGHRRRARLDAARLGVLRTRHTTSGGERYWAGSRSQRHDPSGKGKPFSNRSYAR